jgi:thiol-disulfide isomerase/thioredoxin
VSSNTPSRSRPPRPSRSSATRARPPTRRSMSRRPAPAAGRPSGRGSGLTPTRLVVAGLVAAVVLALVVALVAGGGDDGSTDTTAGGDSSPAATPEGGGLPQLPEDGEDPAVGQPMPTLTGTDLDGQPITYAADGRPKMMLFLAHWCPHCQAEVPVVQDWVDGGGLPDGVDLISVATANDDRRPNFPASEWLADEGWTAPVLLDGDDQAAATAAGLSAFPYWVFVDADGTVAARATGELTSSQLSDIAGGLAESAATGGTSTTEALR